MGTGRRRWLASERIAFRMLEEQGFRILATHQKLVVDGVEVGEADAIAIGPDGSKYVVEVKAGRLDVHGVRQAYTNALILDAKPLVVAKGFADDAAKALADRLGVKVIPLEDVFLVDAEELEDIVYTAAMEAVAEVATILLNPPTVPPHAIPQLEAIAVSSNIIEAAKRLGIRPSDLREVVDMLKSSTQLARRAGWRGVQLAASLVLQGLRLRATMESLRDSSEKLAENLRKLL